MTTRSSAPFISPPALTAIAIVFFAVSSFLYAFRIPAWIPYDEPFHFLYAEKILAQHELPDWKSNYQAAHPPLYYTVTAAVLTPARSLPYEKQLLLARSLSGIFGIALLFAIRAIAFAATDDPELSAIAVAVAASMPMLAALFASVTNDTLSILLAALGTLVICGRETDANIWKRTILAGFLCGAAMLTKITTAFLIPLFAISLLLPLPNRPFRLTVAAMRFLIFLLITAAMTAPWFIYGHRVFGPNMFRNVAIVPHPYNILWPPSHIYPWARMLFSSFWHYKDFLRNSPAVAIPIWVFIIFLVFSILAIIGAVSSFISVAAKRKWTSELRSAILFTAAICAGFAQMFLFNLATYNASGRYLYPMLGPIMALAAIGLKKLLGAKAYPLAVIFLMFTFAFNLQQIFTSVSAIPHVLFKITEKML